MSVEGGDREGDGRWRMRHDDLLADELMAQVEWKEMCLDIRGMIVAWSDDMGPTCAAVESATETKAELPLAVMLNKVTKIW